MSLDVGLDPVSDLNAEPSAFAISGDPITNASGLQALVDDAGLTGYDFENTTTLLADLVRLRTELWGRGSIYSPTGPVGSRLPDPWVVSAGDPQVVTTGDGFGQTRADGVEFIFPAGNYTEVDFVHNLVIGDFECLCGPKITDGLGVHQYITLLAQDARFKVVLPAGVTMANSIIEITAQPGILFPSGALAYPVFTNWNPKTDYPADYNERMDTRHEYSSGRMVGNAPRLLHRDCGLRLCDQSRHEFIRARDRSHRCAD